MNLPLNIDFQQILLHLLNFVVLFAILYFLLYEPVKSFMDKRTQYYKDIEIEAKKNLQEAEQIKQEYTQKLHSVDSEIEEKRQTAYQAINEKTTQSMLSAKQEAEAIIAEAHKKAENEHRKILENAQVEIADMVADAAQKLIINASTSEAYDSFLNSVQRSETNE